MNVLKGHLTAGNKKAIVAILEAGLNSGKVGKTSYYLIEKEKGLYEVTIKKMDRGLIPCPGSVLRLSSHKAEFKIK